MSLTPPFNAGDSGCTAPGSSPTVLTTAGGLSGRIFANWSGDAANGFSGSLTPAQTALIKSQCYQFALAVMQELAAEIPSLISFPYLNSWTDYGGGFRAAAYWKDPFNRVGVVGLAKAPAGGSSAAIGQLPAGFRPSATLQFESNSFNGASNVPQPITVDSSGNIAANGSTLSAGSNITLSVISFLAEQ